MTFSKLPHFYLVILVIQNRLNSLFSSTDPLCLVLDHRAWRVSLVNAGSSLINSSNQQRNSVRPRHRLLFWWRVTLAEVQSQIGNGLSECFYCNWLKISISVVQSLYSSMLNQGPSVSDHSTCRATYVRVDFENFLDWFRDNESWVESALYCQNDALDAFDANCWWAKLHNKSGTLMASIAYSTWKIRPSGEKVLMPRS